MDKIKIIGRRFFVSPIARLFMKFRVHPNVITISSLLFAVLAFFIYRQGKFWLGGIFCFLSGIFDAFDGEVARKRNIVSKFGAFLDSTVDRINEFLVYLGMFFYYFGRQNYVLTWVLIAVFGSLMVSYTRARAEGMGISPQVGIFERFARLTILILGSFFGPRIMIYIIAVLAVGTLLTMIHRMIYVLISSNKSDVNP